MEHNDAIQIKAAIQKQNELLDRIATASERTNELLWALLSAEQQKTVRNAGVHRLAKSVGKSQQP
jgi:hypothetical protein